ncbi:hypothetical protein K443DRAFT_11451 [Laccaria amethystina LaAM-08-1]|uniref:Unplaced genomic scaffold K443scaffold_225, whole genome shotgun sequence n=1 Tax=Laccaria amethystina LaAM-08-1 TaxID=1095629 RepID=A0A0C9WTK4_9AGAR|nr:hypothetical protein K443DRAFT_11451 [Laccaria amethystina LaAM-08-1]
MRILFLWEILTRQHAHPQAIRYVSSGCYNSIVGVEKLHEYEEKVVATQMNLFETLHLTENLRDCGKHHLPSGLLLKKCRSALNSPLHFHFKAEPAAGGNEEHPLSDDDEGAEGESKDTSVGITEKMVRSLKFPGKQRRAESGERKAE